MTVRVKKSLFSKKKTTEKQYELEILELRARIHAEATPFLDDTPEKKKARVERGSWDMEYFGKEYFPHYIKKPSSKLHKKLYADLAALIIAKHPELIERSGLEIEYDEDGKAIVKAAPRGNAKSTITTLIFPIWCIVYEYKKFTGIISDTTEQAGDFLEFIKEELISNERLAMDFPDAVGENKVKWAYGNITTMNGIKFKCWGTRKKLRGARFNQDRPDLLLLDDCENDENINSQDQRKKNEDWLFGAVLKAGTRRTDKVMVGTVLHPESLLMKCINNPGWEGEIFRSILKYSESKLWDEWEILYTDLSNPERVKDADAFFNANREAMLEGAEVLWEEEEDYYYLIKMRTDDGPVYFDREKQNLARNPEECPFDPDWFVFYGEDEHRRIKDLDSFGAVDPSMGKKGQRGKKGSDPSATGVAKVDKDGYIYIEEADIARKHPDKIAEDIFHFHDDYDLKAFGIETIQFQEFFKDHFDRLSRLKRKYVPTISLKPNQDKRLRIISYQPLIKNGTIKFRKARCRTLIEQLTNFPFGADDGPDMVWMLLQVIKQKYANKLRVIS
jgi:predicted phage terminase large subunit-like protein